MNIYGEYFYGNRISDYGLQNGYVDYGTLAKAFAAVLNNDIKEKTEKIRPRILGNGQRTG